MKLKFTYFIFFLLFSLNSYSQEFGIKFSGFVKNDFFLDTRQTVSLREGHFLLYPTVKNYDSEGNDLNDQTNLNFLSIQTRLTGNITAPDVLGAKVSGLIEADFFGNENAAFVDANGFRLRHAFAKVKWTNTELLFGQFWHPFFNTNCFSEVISFNTGAPFQPFSRNPQIRITQKFGPISFVGAVATQRDFISPTGSNVLRNAIIPDLNGQILFENINDKTKTEIYTGAGIEYKTLKPLLFTVKSGKTYSTDEKINSFAVMAFFKIKTPSFSFKTQGIYGQNLFDLTMMGGYAVSEILDTSKNKVKYTALNNMSLWSEVMITALKNIHFGLWAGYTQNLGANDDILFYSNRVGGTDITVRGANPDNSSDIKSILRVSPRIMFVFDKINFVLETEYTSAAYATKDVNGVLYRDSKGKITQTENISNIRVLFSTILKF